MFDKPEQIILGFLGGSVGKESTCNTGDLGLIPGSARSPGEGNGNPLQYSCLRILWAEESGGLQSEVAELDQLSTHTFYILLYKVDMMMMINSTWYINSICLVSMLITHVQVF